VLAGVSAILTIIAVAVNLYRKYAVGFRNTAIATEDGSQIAIADANTSFASAVAMLGNAIPAVRLSGLSVLVNLADGWQNGRQQCIDAICGYFRLPPEESQMESWSPAENEIRQTILRAIRNHLRADAAHSWDGHSFDFTGAKFYDADFSGVLIESAKLNFNGVRFEGGTLGFAGAIMAGGTIDLSGSSLVGTTVSFAGTTLLDGQILFHGASIEDSDIVWLGCKFLGGRLSFRNAHLDSRARLIFLHSVLESTDLSFVHASISGGLLMESLKLEESSPDFHSIILKGGTLSLAGLELDGPIVDFENAIIDNGRLDLSRANFRSGSLHFSGSEFNGGVVDFGGTDFSGGSVDFFRAHFNGGIVAFAEAPSALRPGAISSLDLDDPPAGVLPPSSRRGQGGSAE
jgi:uncharacterized protein YjbI with pentapeptide repeats